MDTLRVWGGEIRKGGRALWTLRILLVRARRCAIYLTPVGLVIRLRKYAIIVSYRWPIRRPPTSTIDLACIRLSVETYLIYGPAVAGISSDGGSNCGMLVIFNCFDHFLGSIQDFSLCISGMPYCPSYFCFSAHTGKI
jgi:hypothetical protein